MTEMTTEEVLAMSDKLLAEVETSNEESRQKLISRLIKRGKSFQELEHLNLEEILEATRQQAAEDKDVILLQKQFLSQLKDSHDDVLMKKVRDLNDRLKNMSSSVREMENSVKDMNDRLN